MEAQDKRESLIDSVSAIPLVETPVEDNLLDAQDATQVFEKLAGFNSSIPDRTIHQRNIFLHEILSNPDIERQAERIVLSADQLRGILAKMAILSSAQTAVDIGVVTRQNKALEQLFGAMDAEQ